MVEIDEQWRKPIKTPIGVYVSCVLVILKFGILNFIGYFSTIRQAEGDVDLPIVVISLSICALTAGSAIWAMLGDNAGRIALMVVTPLNILWPILLAIPMFLSDDKEQATAAVTTIIGQIFLSFWVIGLEWYFMTKKVVEYYKQDG